MNDKKERVYSEEDLCEYTILQKIDELEKQLKNIKNEFNDLYETKEAANAIHVKLRQSDAKINNRIDGLYNITPTDVGVKDNKLGLLHDATWLTNQDAINIGDGLTYDETTKTLKASGGGGNFIVEIQDVYKTIPANTYEVGDFSIKNIYNKPQGTISVFITPSYPIVFKAGTAVFVATPILDKQYFGVQYNCVQAGTVEKSISVYTRIAVTIAQ